ncbi:MAG: M48 family metalloprotease, partial [Candidatus Dojkabacteria bacterium]|nr:M48 family metalloprotease [Candidatus Dojkabacteria bacterium]
AFATGRNQKTSVVCFTRGIIEILNREELKGVIAHEIAHIKNRDVLLATIVAVIASAISSISQIGFFFGGNNEENRNPIVTLLVMIFAPIAAVLVQLAISRSREYLADATAASALGSGKGLANALLKIDKNIQLLPSANINPAFSSLFIANPLKGDDFLSIFSTHPPIKKRVEKLLQFDNVK